ncbi:dinuclear metal center YbgI/SA1388 family protein [Halanaerobium saccharolyticum]|uniref:GTP cyclohydrolase 1 type 2 homolog n=1 Tax=Halanaerobium saccharolyticum TaxID=43595 RepID=A0A4R7Z764_9FIRM|nr:Nif3-like dinuclear metal center hexameric protein [Halanaerobium saccharolyticum]RAK10359.1 dinuclear metal center YbgI/SA1388 family protein [Halanaerobium saccharolyticum]TDW05305.1 dinuclear metal center YbgI/SA1388 family protein [Halanaerobium saccharolyticum]TDX60375.1 dinuclear metal center YbgI/SA1388 family protein [Halanaerobium saccharolyticum]
MAKVAEVIQLMGKLAPARLAEDWDNVGMQVGDGTQEVKNVLLALDFNQKVLTEAVEKNCQLIITHHPFIFNGIKAIDAQNQSGKLIFELIKNNISLFSAHTNLDIAAAGLNDYLIKKLDVENISILKTTNSQNYYKLVTFIPEDKFEEVRDALYAQGAGKYKNYSHTGFYQQGKGSFKPLTEAEPYLGDKGEINEIEEYRFETIIDPENLNQVINKLLKVHPYEEPAWDLYKMENLESKKGIGRIADLKSEIKLDELLKKIKEVYKLEQIKVVRANKKIKRVALCSGSGADFIKDAHYQGADLYLTGDVKFHEAQTAEELGLSLVDFGHYGSEKFVKELLSDRLNKIASSKLKKELNFIQSVVNTDPWNYQ